MPVVLNEPPPVGDTTVDSLINEVYRHLEANSFGVLNRLVGDIAEDDETVAMEFDTQKAARPGAYICIDIEVMYVWAYDESSQVATVQRGMLGSVRQTHAAGALVQVQPRTSRFDVLTQIIHEIRSWPPALYAIGRIEFGVSSTTRVFDLSGADDLYRVLEVRSVTTPTTVGVAPVPRGVTHFHVDFNADTTVYPSGKAIVFDATCALATHEVIYALPFTTDGIDGETTLSAVGLTNTQRDIPVLGAASRLLREAPRTSTQPQGQSSTDARVPPGYTGSTRTALRREADTRIHQEIARLREKYPQRRR